MSRTPARSAASTSVAVPSMLLCQYLPGRLHRLGHRLVGGEVHDRRHPVVAAHLLDERRVVDVALDQRRAEQGVGPPELERVEHDDVAPAVAQRADGVRPDVPGTAGDEDGHLAGSLCMAENLQRAWSARLPPSLDRPAGTIARATGPEGARTCEHRDRPRRPGLRRRPRRPRRLGDRPPPPAGRVHERPHGDTAARRSARPVRGLALVQGQPAASTSSSSPGPSAASSPTAPGRPSSSTTT